MTTFLIVVLALTIAGWMWAPRSANMVASRVVLGLTAASAVFALVKLWTWDPNAPADQR